MDLVIRRDIRQLVLDVRKIQWELDRLKQDQKAWARDQQQDDLSDVIDRLKRLEFDVSVIQADCVSIAVYTGRMVPGGSWRVYTAPLRL